MGKAVRKFMEDIAASLLAAELDYAGYNRLREQFVTFTDSSIGLLQRQIGMLNGEHGGSLEAAREAPGYVALVQEIAKKDAIAEAQVARLNNFAARIAAKLTECENSLTGFEKFVKTKEASRTLPWKRRSIAGSRAFIANARKTLAGTKRPRPVGPYGG